MFCLGNVSIVHPLFLSVRSHSEMHNEIQNTGTAIIVVIHRQYSKTWKTSPR